MMNENQTLIVYGMRMSVTQKNSLEIAHILQTKSNLEVDVLNLKNAPLPNLEPYSNIFIGGGIVVKDR